MAQELIVRDLLTRWKIKADNSQLENFEDKIDQFVKKVDSVEARVTQVGRKLQGVGSSLTKFVTLPLTLLAGQGLKTAANLEQLQVAFNTMLGDATQAEAFFKRLIDFTAKTPFQLDQVANSAKALLAFGFGEAEIIPMLERIGDLSAGLDQPINELAQIFGKARVQGRLMQEDVNQLTERGIPIYQELAKQFGVAEGEVRKLVETGKVGFPQLQKALVALTSEGGKFAGLTRAQSKSLGGVFSTFLDNINLAAAAIGETLAPAVKPVLSLLSDLANSFATSNTSVKLLVTGIVVLGLAVPPLLLALGTFLVLLPKITLAFGLLKAAMLSPFTAIGGMIQAMIRQYILLGNAAFSAWAKTLAPILAVIALIGFMFLLIDDIITSFQGGESFFGTFFDLEVAFEAWSKIGDIAKAALASLGTWIAAQVLQWFDIGYAIDKWVELATSGVNRVKAFFGFGTDGGSAASDASTSVSPSATARSVSNNSTM